MNIGIITVYNSENCGSFLQAYALYRFLSDNGHQVSFYKRETKGTTHDIMRVAADSAKLLFQLKFNLCYNRICSYCSFSKVQKMLPVHSSFKDKDTIIIGSDTMWNFDDAYFWKMRSLYSGYYYSDKHTITYAVSIANTQLETLENESIILEGIKSINSISVRDDATYNAVKKITLKAPAKVLDPTLLIDSRNYEYLETKIPSGNYLLLYCFDKFDKEKVDAIIDFANKKNLSIVSFGSLLGWEDIYEPLNPSRFLSFFHKSKYVITDTFHGNAFSIIYKKNFASFGISKNKVKSLLESFGLSERMCINGSCIESVLSVPPSYDVVYTRLEKMRKESKRFLLTSIEV